MSLDEIGVKLRIILSVDGVTILLILLLLLLPENKIRENTSFISTFFIVKIAYTHYKNLSNYQHENYRDWRYCYCHRYPVVWDVPWDTSRTLGLAVPKMIAAVCSWLRALHEVASAAPVIRRYNTIFYMNLLEKIVSFAFLLFGITVKTIAFDALLVLHFFKGCHARWYVSEQVIQLEATLLRFVLSLIVL